VALPIFQVISWVMRGVRFGVKLTHFVITKVVVGDYPPGVNWNVCVVIRIVSQAVT
jgi:hypothetical protein